MSSLITSVRHCTPIYTISTFRTLSLDTFTLSCWPVPITKIATAASACRPPLAPSSALRSNTDKTATGFGFQAFFTDVLHIYGDSSVLHWHLLLPVQCNIFTTCVTCHCVSYFRSEQTPCLHSPLFSVKPLTAVTCSWHQNMKSTGILYEQEYKGICFLRHYFCLLSHVVSFQITRTGSWYWRHMKRCV
jgi:hypothetical protein